MSKWTDANYPVVTPKPADQVLILQASSGRVKQALVSALANGGGAVKVVGTIAELRAVPSDGLGNNDIAVVIGYNEANDGGGGEFYYDRSGGDADNDGTVIEPDSGVGRWYRLYSGAINAQWFGAIGDGIEDDSDAVQAMFNAAASGETIVFQSGKTYRITEQIQILGKNLTVVSYGASFVVEGNQSGFLVAGTVTKFVVKGGTITGDGVNRDANSANAQFGWVFGSVAGASVQNVSVEDVEVSLTNVGLRAAYGTAGGGPAYNCWFVNCHASEIVGEVGGVGYGFHFAQAPGSGFVNCTADKCGRHGMYFSEGRDYVASNCILRNHRNGDTVGNYEAFAVSRSRNVVLSNCIFDNNYTYALNIDVDTQGVAPDNVLDGVRVNNCIFRDSHAVDIQIGTSTPSVTGYPTWVSITDCQFIGKAATVVVGINVQSGHHIRIEDNDIDHSASAAGSRAIKLIASEGQTYSDDFWVQSNRIRSAGVGINVAAAFITGTSVLLCQNNDVDATSGDYDFDVSINTQTNNSTIIKRGATEERSAVDADTTPCVSGVDALALANTGATSITQFDGGVSGQLLTLYFENGNTTINDSASIVLAGSANFNGTAQDTLTLRMVEGAWVETSRSAN